MNSIAPGGSTRRASARCTPTGRPRPTSPTIPLAPARHAARDRRPRRVPLLGPGRVHQRHRHRRRRRAPPRPLVRFRVVAVLLVLLVVATGALYTFPASDFIFTPGQREAAGEEGPRRGRDARAGRRLLRRRLRPARDAGSSGSCRSRTRGLGRVPRARGASRPARPRRSAIARTRSTCRSPRRSRRRWPCGRSATTSTIEPVGLRVATVFSDGPAAAQARAVRHRSSPSTASVS